MDVSQQREQVALLLHEKSFVPTLEQVTHTLMAVIESLGIERLKRQHDARQRDRAALKCQMNVIVHQAVGKDSELVAGSTLGQSLEVCLAILVVSKDGLPFVTAGDDMVDAARKLDSQRPCHEHLQAGKSPYLELSRAGTPDRGNTGIHD
jgi:hypothetical protein